MKRCLVLLAAVLCAMLGRSGHAQGLDDQYVQIYNLIQEGDSFKSAGQSSQALAKYTEAQDRLVTFQRGNPDWNTTVVSFRLGYLADQIAALSGKVPASAPSPAPAKPGAGQSKPPPGNTNAAPPPTRSPSAAVPENPAPPADWEQQLNLLKARLDQLQGQLGQMQSDKSLLESKLKEAFSAQPPAADQRELERTREQLKSLQKENDLLKVTVGQEKSKPAAEGNAKALADAQQALAEANRKLSAQTLRANSLAQEKQFLQDKLTLLAPENANASALQSTRKALADANRQLAEQKALASRLTLQKDALQAHITALSALTNRQPVLANPQVSESELAALRAENALLKKQLSAVQTAPAVASNSSVLPHQLAEAQAQLAALLSDKELWRLEKIALENRIRQLQSRVPVPAPVAAAAPAVAPPVVPDTKASKRIRQLEQERNELKKQLAAANKELANRKNQAAAARVEELESQLASLHARLDAFEARQVPYTAEELALFKQPKASLASTEAKPQRESVQELPPAAARLVVEARGYFSAAEYDKAEQAYIEAARLDQKNVPILANLAAIEVERNRFDEADANLKQALALKPDDAYTLFVLGNLRFRQAKYDDALEALSRAAKLDPLNAEVQNYLGLTLSEKGMRIPAETALRKAVDLDPNYGSAHNNLAVIYLTQQPPAVELARFHYQKALAAGAPHNPELEKMLDQKESGGRTQE